MTMRILDLVVLNDDQPEHGLKRGDLGTVVEVYTPDAVEVEFVRASGRTQAMVTLPPSAIRDVSDDDLVAVQQRAAMSNTALHSTPPRPSRAAAAAAERER